MARNLQNTHTFIYLYIKTTYIANWTTKVCKGCDINIIYDFNSRLTIYYRTSYNNVFDLLRNFSSKIYCSSLSEWNLKMTRFTLKWSKLINAKVQINNINWSIRVFMHFFCPSVVYSLFPFGLGCDSE